MKTTTVPVSAPIWYVLDAEGQNIGRVAVRVANVLRGKHKPSFSPHQLCGDQVVIINAAKVTAHPKKLLTKRYVRHSGYLGHLKSRTLGQMLEEKPERVMEQAIYGMLPRSRIRLALMKRVHIFADAEHPHAPQKPVSLSL
ncbi:MAG: 50S ribosomal protein L13 [Candidatus Peribacteraceae bacterium]